MILLMNDSLQGTIAPEKVPQTEMITFNDQVERPAYKQTYVALESGSTVIALYPAEKQFSPGTKVLLAVSHGPSAEYPDIYTVANRATG